MFESDLIDRFSRTPAWLVPALYAPAALIVWAYGHLTTRVPWSTSLAIAGAGFLTWTFLEYWLHRTLFHWVPGGAFGERMHFVLHGVHHKWPRDRYRLVMPLSVSVTLFWLSLALFLWLGGDHGYGYHAGFAVGYMTYDTTHYYIHHYKPRSRWFKDLRRHHLIHHAPQATHRGKFGVSTTLWDHIFGTY